MAPSTFPTLRYRGRERRRERERERERKKERTQPEEEEEEEHSINYRINKHSHAHACIDHSSCQVTRRLEPGHSRVLNFHKNQPGVLRDINRLLEEINGCEGKDSECNKIKMSFFFIIIKIRFVIFFGPLLLSSYTSPSFLSLSLSAFFLSPVHSVLSGANIVSQTLETGFGIGYLVVDSEAETTEEVNVQLKKMETSIRTRVLLCGHAGHI